MTGAGEVASLTFRVLREGDASIRLESIDARDTQNRPLAPEAIGRATLAQLPARTVLLAPWPNPSPGAATLSFAMAEAGPAELAIFSVDSARFLAPILSLSDLPLAALAAPAYVQFRTVRARSTKSERAES